MIQLADHIDVQYDRNVTMKVKVSQFDSVYTFKSHDKNFLCVSSDIVIPLKKDQPPSERQLVFCRNSDYAFQLTRSGPKMEWFLKDLENNAAVADKTMRAEFQLDRVPLFALQVFHEFLPEWSQEIGFVIKSVDWDDQPSGRRVAVSFEADRPDKRQQKSLYWARSGVLFLRPDLCWAVEEFQTEMVDDGDSSGFVFHMSHKNKLRPLANGFVALEGATESFESKSEGSVQSTWKFNRFETREVPEEEFTLAAFGLTDLSRPAVGRSTRLWMFLTIAGIVCIVTGIIIRNRGRRAPQ